MLYDTTRFDQGNIGRSGDTLSTRKTGMALVFLVSPFFPCQPDLISIDNNDIVPTVYMGGEIGLVLAS